MNFALDPYVLKSIIITLGIITAGIVILKPVMGLLIICFILPQEALVYGSLSLPVFPLLGMLTVAGYLFHAVILRTKYDTPIRQYKIDYIIMLLLVLWILLLPNPLEAWHPTPPFGMDPLKTRSNFVFKYFQLGVLYYLGSQLLRSRHLPWLALALMLGTTLSALYDLDAVMIGSEFGESVRMEGAYEDANVFASFALCGLTLLPAVLKTNQSRTIIGVALILALFQVIIICLTLSRTIFLASSLILFLWFCFQFKYKINLFNKRVVLLAVAYLMIVAVFIPIDYLRIMYETITAGVLHGEGTAGIRFRLWQGALSAFQTSPIWGIGVGKMLWFNLREFAVLGKHVGMITHNTYLNILGENGIVGLALFLGWVGMALHRFWGVFKTGSTWSMRYLALAGLSALVSILFLALTYNVQTSKLLWLLAGCSISLSADAARLSYGFLPKTLRRPYPPEPAYSVTN
ncbi:MAG: O-antigen ligase family protein [Desulfobacteraceae bacterium]